MKTIQVDGRRYRIDELIHYARQILWSGDREAPSSFARTILDHLNVIGEKPGVSKDYLDPELMDVKELAEYLRLTPPYVRSMAGSGRIPKEAIVKNPGRASKYYFKRNIIKEWARYKG